MAKKQVRKKKGTKVKVTPEKVTKVKVTPAGLGDVVENVLESKPIKPLTKVIKKAIFKDKDDCGCEERKQKLNKMFPIRRKAVRCFTEDLYNRYSKYVNSRTLKLWNDKEIDLLIESYAYIFATQYRKIDLCKNCQGSGKLLLKMSNELDKVHQSYES